MKIEITYEQFDLLLSQLPRFVEQYEREAAALLQLEQECEVAKDLALERLRLSQDIAELVSRLVECQQEDET